ncbi:hypothetical protein QR680_011099 [Steinernema hermaphroditum]|uniref:RING-type domain-containing protein n=1 Tax=Steinernema hermaphroditum TaxID=289476 RepID=A0AA39MCW7_9BILA|nr:hypothetical protein QR680_011099 [Steinernema hermaphroditum]
MADQNPETRVDYFCHQCHMQFHTHGRVQECTRCGDGFIEQIPRPDNYPAQYMPPGFGMLFQGLGRPSTSAPNAQPAQGQQEGQQAPQQGEQNRPRMARPNISDELVRQIINFIHSGGANAERVQAQAGQQPAADAPPQQQQGQAQRAPGQIFIRLDGTAAFPPGFGAGAPPQQPNAEEQQQQPGAMPQMPGPGGVPVPGDFIQNLFHNLIDRNGIEVRMEGDLPENLQQYVVDDNGADEQQNEEEAQGAAQDEPRVRRGPRGFSIRLGAGGLESQAFMDVLNSALGMDGERSDRISDADIERLPMTKITAQQADKQCTTCMDHLHEGDDVGRLNCGHMFHRPCIEPWLKRHNTCPVCRSKIDPSKWVLQQMQDNDMDLD